MRDMAQQVDAGIFQAALLQIAEATQAAANAAQAAQQVAASTTTTAASSGTGTGGAVTVKAQVDWSKLVNRPPIFDYPNQEQDQRHFRDWLWQLSQYLICVDEGFTKELEQVTEEPSKALDIESGPLEVRQRSAKLYGLLAGLVKNRALSIVRATPNGNGFEALRQLVLAMRPNTQARGLSLLSSVTAWPAFSMSKPLQAQLLRLEDAYEETRRAGTTLSDELKSAIALRCITGALKTHLSLSLKETSTYAVRRFYVGTELIRSGQIVCKELMTLDQMLSPWRWIAFREKANTMTKEKGSMKRVAQRANQNRKAKTRTSQRRAMTRATIQAKGNRARPREKGKVASQKRHATCATNQVILRKIAGVL